MIYKLEYNIVLQNNTKTLHDQNLGSFIYNNNNNNNFICTCITFNYIG